ATDIVRVHHTVATIGDRPYVGYRLTLREGGEDLVVEQHAYATLIDSSIARLRIMCSGFAPVHTGVVADGELTALGDGCATLTPRIAAAVRGLAPGQVLAVLTDDPTAPDGLAAWCRLTGHELVSAVVESEGTRFLIRHR